MPRIRSIKPEFFKDADLAQLPPLHRIAYAGLWCMADREGRLKDNPLELKMDILPYDDVDFNIVLNNLAGSKKHGSAYSFIVRYSLNGNRFIHINKFLEHQCPNIREPKSTIPAPDEHGTSIIQGQCLYVGKGRERKGRERKYRCGTV